jgi:hypothetical protein
MLKKYNKEDFFMVVPTITYFVRLSRTIFPHPLQRTGMFLSLYLIIKEEAFPWFGPFWFV